jgi:hypothetical protein
VGTPFELQDNQDSRISAGLVELENMTSVANNSDNTKIGHIAIYAGSSTADLKDRVRHQERAIETMRIGKRPPYHHQVVQEMD